ncbi:hypothetical protein M514_23865 [Trichuris suis]|uniref:Uncharacterized protein n=1 Tax=Trichuris suis TaxID=68888 RepID=A0A085N328_9BILA|nr:hypothetical protein M514_23865 [Trichuris suis]
MPISVSEYSLSLSAEDERRPHPKVPACGTINRTYGKKPGVYIAKYTYNDRSGGQYTATSCKIFSNASSPRLQPSTPHELTEA